MIPRQVFLKTINDVAGSVYDFHDRFRIESLDSLSKEDDVYEIMSTRVLLQTEEVGELCRALNKMEVNNIYEEGVDALYIALGTVLSSGNFGISACEKVVEKNNGKTLSSHGIGASSGKVIRK